MMYEEASQVANDAVSSIRTVASFCAEQKVMDRSVLLLPFTVIIVTGSTWGSTRCMYLMSKTIYQNLRPHLDGC